MINTNSPAIGICRHCGRRDIIYDKKRQQCFFCALDLIIGENKNAPTKKGFIIAFPKTNKRKGG